MHLVTGPGALLFFRMSGSTGRIMQKFGVLLDPLTIRFTQAINGGYLQLRKCDGTSFFKHICSLPLIYRPKGGLLVLYTIHGWGDRIGCQVFFILFHADKRRLVL